MKDPKDTQDNLASDWNINDERVLIEKILYQRFHFFLAFFSLVVAGAIGTMEDSGPRPHLYMTIGVLLIGTVICWFMASMLKHSQAKLDLILGKMLPKDHPAVMVNSLTQQDGNKRKFNAQLITAFCCWVLTIACFTVVLSQIVSNMRTRPPAGNRLPVKHHDQAPVDWSVFE